jgi:hypothetical protein
LPIVLAVAFAAPSCAQSAPSPPTADLSGTWILNAAKSTQPRRGKIRSETIVIRCDGPKIKMTFTRNQAQRVEQYVADGKEHIVSVVQGDDVFHKAYWEQSALVTEQSTHVNRVALESKERWELAADGHTLTRKSDTDGSILVYDKR